MTFIKNRQKLFENIIKFEQFIKVKDAGKNFKSNKITFSTPCSWLYEQEYYKRGLSINTYKLFNCKLWNEKDIGTGRIIKAVQAAIKEIGDDNRLVNWRTRQKFNTKIDGEPNHQLMDSAFYHLYRGDDEEKALSELVKIFGRTYDLLAFLFFAKDPNRYLPIHSRDFDHGFKNLGISLRTAGKCSWSNYNDFISTISEIQGILRTQPKWDPTLTLLDAHSFVWIVCNDYYGWEPNEESMEQIAEEANRRAMGYGSENPKRRETKSSDFTRDPKVIAYVKNRARGVCELCGQPAPFNDKNGEPYLEVHHVDWLARGGADKTDNAVALCPNCHCKMHIVDDPNDVQHLKKLLKVLE